MLTVDAFVVRPAPSTSAGTLAARIDALFANSTTPTRTQSEKQFLEGFLRQYADVGLIINLVIGTAFVTLLMIVINTMVFAVRERTFEIGLLKALGFSRRRILLLVLSETLFLFALGGTLGLVFSTAVLAKAASLIAALGLVTGLIPAINAMRTPIAAAFRAR